MLEAGVAFATVAAIMGWSATATARMAKRYGHIGQEAQRQAVEAISSTKIADDSCAFPFDIEQRTDTAARN
jgi:hypothetical protein